MRYVALDIETANEERSSICSIGLAKFEHGEIVDEYYTLINPEVDYFSFMNIEVHGITEEDVVDKPTFPEVMKEIEEFIDNHLLVAHFSQFDMYAIQDAYQKYGLNIPPLNYICSYSLSKNIYQLPSYRLVKMAEHFNVDTANHHHALSDARMAGYITYNILQENNLDINTFNKDYRYRVGVLGQNGYTKKKLGGGGNRPIEVKVDESKFQEGHEFYQKNICFTGTLQAYTRAEIAQVVTDIGANFHKGVQLTTNYLVVGNLENLEKASNKKKSSKIIKAEKLASEGKDIEILSEMDFMQLL